MKTFRRSSCSLIGGRLWRVPVSHQFLLLGSVMLQFITPSPTTQRALHPNPVMDPVGGGPSWSSLVMLVDPPPDGHLGTLHPGLAPGAGPGDPDREQEQTVPDIVALETPETLKPFHHNKNPIQEGMIWSTPLPSPTVMNFG